MRVTWDPGKRPDDLSEGEAIDQGLLYVLKSEHDQSTHGGLHAIRALVYCHEARVQLPTWLVDWLGERFAEWLDGKSDSLDSALAVRSPGRGQAPALKQFNLTADRSWDAWNMALLIRFIGLSIDRAAEAVQRRNEAENQSTPDAAWLAESWRKKWSKDPKYDPAKVGIEFTDEDRKRLLSNFPKDLGLK